MPSQSTSGSQACTVTTEHSLASTTTAGTYCLRIDLNAAVDGTTPDRFRVAVKTKTLTGSTARYEQSWEIEGAQYLDNWISDPVPSVHYVEFLLTQTTGTSRTVDWSLVRVDA